MKERLTESVYLRLRDDIFNARYDPNELIVERDIAEKYGVSKVTASEALHRLCSEGHLTSHPRSGCTVTLLSPSDLEQIKRMRLTLEALVIDILCAEAGDDEIRALHDFIVDDDGNDIKFAAVNTRFHLAMANLTRDKYLVTALTNLLGALSRMETVMSRRYREKWHEWHEPHRRILASLLARDAEAAKKHLREDLNQ